MCIIKDYHEYNQMRAAPETVRHSPMINDDDCNMMMMTTTTMIVR